MSTKIYVAYRIPRSKIDHFIAEARKLVFAGAVEQMERLMWNVKKKKALKAIGCVKKGQKRKWVKEGGERFNRLSYAFEWPIEDSERGVRGFNLDSWLNCWPNGRYWYIIPCWPDGVKIKDEDLPEYVEEYGYWNNVDPPEHVTWKQWRERERKWEEVCVEDHNRTRLSHVIIEAKGPHHIGLDVIEKTIAAKGPWPEQRGFGAAYRASLNVSQRRRKKREELKETSENSV